MSARGPTPAGLQPDNAYPEAFFCHDVRFSWTKFAYCGSGVVIARTAHSPMKIPPLLICGNSVYMRMILENPHR
jgi:hypothetical protein